VSLECSTVNGRSVDVRKCGLFTSADPEARITAEALRRVPLAALAKAGMWAAAMRRNHAGEWDHVIPDEIRHRISDVTVWQADSGSPDDEPRTWIQLTDLDPKWVEKLEKAHGKLVEEKRGPGVRTETWWKNLERAYLDAIENHEPTGEAVARAMHMSLQSAKNAITEARRCGYNLPKRGRVK
jgi:hypothetical protein